MDALTAMKQAQKPVVWWNPKYPTLSVQLTKPYDGGGWEPLYSAPTAQTFDNAMEYDKYPNNRLVQTFDEYWEEAQHHVNSSYHAGLEIWKCSRQSTLMEASQILHSIAFDQRRSPLATDGALMCKEAIMKLLRMEKT